MEQIRSIKIKLEVDSNKQTLVQSFTGISQFILYLIDKGVLQTTTDFEVNTDKFIE